MGLQRLRSGEQGHRGKYEGYDPSPSSPLTCLSLCISSLFFSLARAQSYTSRNSVYHFLHDLLDPYMLIRIRMWCAFLAVGLFSKCSRRYELDRVYGES